jgi:hypothetical protein
VVLYVVDQYQISVGPVPKVFIFNYFLERVIKLTIEINGTSQVPHKYYSRTQILDKQELEKVDYILTRFVSLCSI